MSRVRQGGQYRISGGAAGGAGASIRTASTKAPAGHSSKSRRGPPGPTARRPVTTGRGRERTDSSSQQSSGSRRSPPSALQCLHAEARDTLIKSDDLWLSRCGPLPSARLPRLPSRRLAIAMLHPAVGVSAGSTSSFSILQADLVRFLVLRLYSTVAAAVAAVPSLR